MRKFLRTIFLIINILLAVAMLISTLAGVIPPTKVWWVSILSYGYFPLLLVNVAFIIVWLCLSRWEFLISVVAIAVRYAFMPLFFQIGGTLEVVPNDNTLKVMTFNTHSFNGLDDNTCMARDSGVVLFLKLIDEEQPDVMSLQECYDKGKVNLLDSLEARGYVHHHGVHGNRTRSPLVLYSRSPILRVSSISGPSKFYADVAKNGRQVRICCVHLDSYKLDNDDLRSFEQLSHAKYDRSSTRKILRKFKETTRCHEQEWKEDLKPLVESCDIPIIIAGDYNDTPASYIYQQATKLLCDPYVEQGRGFGTTYHGPFPAFRIDYILHSNDIEALSYKRIKTNISDHYPVVVQFDLNSRPEGE